MTTARMNPIATQRTGRPWIAGVLLVVMIAAAAAAYQLKPTRYLADQGQAVVLETMVPKAFGDWIIDPSITPLVADPTQLELSDRIYSETLSRTYVNRQGHRMMLTIAYGRDQSESLQLHTPEYCYPATGFKVTPARHTNMSLGFKQQPVVRLEATLRERHEPITYWVTMGEYVVNGGARSRRDVRFIYGFRDLIPDGMLFRISSIGPDDSVEYALQEQFLRELFGQLPAGARDRLAGVRVYD